MDQSTKKKDPVRALDDFKCAICLEYFTDPKTCNCGHTFCAVCVEYANSINNTCPICKKELYIPDEVNTAMKSLVELQCPQPTETPTQIDKVPTIPQETNKPRDSTTHLYKDAICDGCVSTVLSLSNMDEDLATLIKKNQDKLCNVCRGAVENESQLPRPSVQEMYNSIQTAMERDSHRISLPVPRKKASLRPVTSSSLQRRNPTREEEQRLPSSTYYPSEHQNSHTRELPVDDDFTMDESAWIDYQTSQMVSEFEEFQKRAFSHGNATNSYPPIQQRPNPVNFLLNIIPTTNHSTFMNNSGGDPLTLNKSEKTSKDSLQAKEAEKKRKKSTRSRKSWCNASDKCSSCKKYQQHLSDPQQFSYPKQACTKRPQSEKKSRVNHTAEKKKKNLQRK